jgi:ubiquinone/menaquinone biosynthesis C-methylase UbiE
VNARDARALIERAVGGHGGTWADIGAGTGTFTRALVELLGPNSTVYAVDRDAEALAGLSNRRIANVVPVVADLTEPLSLPGLSDKLDGMLLANALHFVPGASSVLGRLVRLVRPGGPVVLVEYDQRTASRWVPNPIPIAHLPSLATHSGLSEFQVVATRPSLYQGTLYCAVATRLAADRA